MEIHKLFVELDESKSNCPEARASRGLVRAEVGGGSTGSEDFT
jgi:hypothetical protein